ncbi:MAG TPA: DUF2177 domain-containing protein [Parachlamydiales bacterium]|nr:DUF2177 domain-containing protein [Parachlamydiales bacterium]
MYYLKLYLTCLIIYTTMDFVWINWVASYWFQNNLGFLLADSIRWEAVFLFYLIYPASLLLFAISPSLNKKDWRHALFYGAALGFSCYITYDLTNLATLRGWPTRLVVHDVLWGTSLSGAVSLLTFTLATKSTSFFQK